MNTDNGYLPDDLRPENEGITDFHGETPFGIYAREYLAVYIRPFYDWPNYRTIRHIAEKVFLNSLSDIPIGEIRLSHLQKALLTIAGCSRSQMDKAVVFIHGLFATARADDIIRRDPSIGLKIPAVTEGQRRALTARERELLLEAIPYVKNGEFFGIMLGCGLRPQEVRALYWENVDFQAHTISVTGAIKKGQREIGPTKSKAGVRTIPMPIWLEQMLRKMPDRREKALIFGKDKPLHENQVTLMWYAVKKRMEILAGAETKGRSLIGHSPEVGQEITPYYLRHTYATTLAEKGIDMKTAQYLLGHANISMTARVYTHVTDKMMQAAAEKIRREL